MSAFTKAAVALLGSVLGATACNAKANPAVAIPAPVVDAPRASIAAKQTAVISGGCFWGVQAVFQHVERRDQRNVGLLRRVPPDRGVRNRQHRTNGPRRIRRDCLRSFADHLRRALARLLFGCARSHPTEPPGTRRRHAISFCNLLQQRRTEAHCGGVRSATRVGESFPTQDRDAGCPAAGFLYGGKLSPELCRAAPQSAVHCFQ
jgi:hypothetical protein